MTRRTLSLTLAALSLLLSALVGSCAGNTAAPAPPAELPEDLPAFELHNPTIETDVLDDDAKSASFTPGLACPIGAGATWPSILNYGWRGGIVAEGAAPNWVKLNTFAGTPPGWIIYNYKEVVAGRLKNIRVFGASKLMRFEMWNWRTGSWVTFGHYDLSAGAANVAVPIEYAPNGSTYVRLTEAVIGTVRIDKIETQVF